MSIPAGFKAFLLGEKLSTWEGEYKIPWHEPDFSRRMLKAHLSQETDAASRRFAVVDRQVARLAEFFTGLDVHRVLDLGCGPGLYVHRLAQRGFSCVGLDFAPASLGYARAFAEREQLDCTFRLTDLRDGSYGSGFDAALFIFGEANAFPPADLSRILGFCAEALVSGAPLVLEVHSFAFVQGIAAKPKVWGREASGLFSDGPYVFWYEAVWDALRKAAVEYYFVVSLEDEGAFRKYVSSTQAYTLADYFRVLEEAGFVDVQVLGNLAGGTLDESGLFEIRAFKK